MRINVACFFIFVTAVFSTICFGDQDPAHSPAGGQQAGASNEVAVQSRDMTPGQDWIKRLERPDRLPGLKIDEVIRALALKDGDVIADIGAGPGVFSMAFARAVAPSGKALAVDIWPELLNYINAKAAKEGLDNVQTILARPDDPMLPPGQVDIAFFHDVFHNVPDRQAYLEVLASYLTPGGRIAIIEQKYDDPIAMKWDVPENRIKPEQVEAWMSNIGFKLIGQYDMFLGENNPPGTGMPERWFVVYARADGE